MIRVTIDGRTLEVPEGSTILDAIRRMGIDVPALCWKPGYEPSTCCMACVVRVDDAEGLVPSCATVARDGMRIESETEDVRAARRTALELLLSDHVGDCVAPCQRADPLHIDLPRFVRQVGARDFVGARATLEAAGALTVGPDGPDTTRAEQACRRARHDSAVNLGLLIRQVAEATADSPAGDPPPPYRKFSVGMGRMADEDLERLLASVSSGPRLELDAGSPCSPDDVCQESERCVRCDCAASETCLLRHYSDAYAATPTAWRGARRVFEQRLDHPDIVLESGKCIGCGLCVQAAERAGEKIGLVLENRGFGVRVTVPFGRSLAKGLEKSALECVEVCPTGAFARRR